LLLLTRILYRLQDEDGTLRDGSTDGYSAEEASKAAVTDTPNPLSHSNQDLEDLRNELKERYPHLADEVEKSLLLLPSKHNYPDIASNNTLLRAHRQCVRLREMDNILQNAQRQGRISFYMTCGGEEAIHIGAGSALELEDTVLAQYREAGILMWRGFTLEQFTDQCFGNKADLGKGRQMPVHYGSRALNYQTISSPLGTQIPQAAGAAYKLKLSGKDAVAACFFGDGCASTTDFHSGLNFAAVLKAPVIFFCRNNGYAISTSVEDQYNGDGIISHAKGYGMAGIRVDGNDIFAVHAAVREARKYALENSAPVLIEAMTYRVGHHSTSDDSLRYRSAGEVKSADASGPITRLENFLRRTNQMSDDDFTNARDEEKVAVLKALQEAERKPGPALEELFKDVYKEMPNSLREQERKLQEHLKRYPNEYS
jgi:2-oxoisovalerate dehydrogenase E1 component alpha subunit